MTEFKVVPEIQCYETVAQYLEENSIGQEDLLVTNKYIYEPYLARFDLNCTVCFQEQYGAGEPSDKMIEKIAAELQLEKFERIIGVGGGTVLDICKLLAQEGVTDLPGLFQRKGLKRARRLVLIPTTCGTGSEVTGTSVVNMTRLGTKLGLVAPSVYCDQAVLIPEFLGSLPYHVFATSSIDALVHGIESYLNPRNNGLITIMAQGSIAAVLSVYRRLAKEGTGQWKAYARELLEASCAAGIAFSNNSCGTVHALSYALGGKYHVPHGESNYQFLIAVLRMYQRKKPDGVFSDLERLLGTILCVPSEESLTELEGLLNIILENKPMRAYGAVAADVDQFTDSTIDSQQRLLSGGYVPLTREEIREVYASRL